MNRILNVHLLPELADVHELAGHPAVVIDVLRASTTITTALGNGASCVQPCLTVEEARERASKQPDALLGGERAGKPLPGFDLGNSPAEYTPGVVGGRPVVFTTTNGTKALSRCLGASSVWLGSLLNRRALCTRLAGASQLEIICAGTDGAISLDDALVAGAIAHQLGLETPRTLNDSAQLCLRLWESCLHEGRPIVGQVEASLTASQGGRNLVALGMQADIALAAELDHSVVVPQLDLASWEIRPSDDDAIHF